MQQRLPYSAVDPVGEKRKTETGPNAVGTMFCGRIKHLHVYLMQDYVMCVYVMRDYVVYVHFTTKNTLPDYLVSPLT